LISHVVLDIEGTTSSTGFVHQTLYPYSRERFRTWIEANLSRADVRAQVDHVRSLASEPEADLDRIVHWLNHWLDGDEKVTPLKAFQGWIWAEGFSARELTSHFFPDAIPAIRRWKAAGLDLSIFSSGSVSAQRAWFGHTPEGDLLPLLSHHFDTENIGPKRVASSYRLIAETLGVSAADIVFLSDLRAELDAAAEAGWNTVGVRREGDQYFDAPIGDHLVVFSFDSVDISGSVPVLLS